MNAKQRERMNSIIGELEAPKSDIEDAQNEEQVKFDNMSEGLQQTERGQAIEQAANSLGDAVGAIEEAISAIEEAIQ